MLNKVLSLLLVLTVSVVGLSACGAKRGLSFPDNTNDDKLKIVATVFPAYDLCKGVVGNEAQLKMLLSPGEEVHSYEPTPQDIIDIYNADVFIYGGGESDAWADRILDSAGQDITVISLMDCADTLNEELKDGMVAEKHDHEEDEHHEDDEHHEEHEDEAEYDEHVWTSPANAIRICENICLTLCRLNPEASGMYTKNAADYINKLKRLDVDFRQVIGGAKNHTLIFADRFPLLYFVNEYGLDYYAAYPGCSTETGSTPKTVAFLIDEIRRNRLPAVLKLEMSNGGMAQTVSEETGAQVLTFYSCQTISKDDFQGGEGYLSLMRRNLDTLRVALY